MIRAQASLPVLMVMVGRLGLAGLAGLAGLVGLVGASACSVTIEPCGPDGGRDGGVDGPAGDGPADAVPGGFCGDGVVNVGEACDDGNDLSTDGCVGCALARCGDGYVRAGAEECDDANGDANDGCTTGCLSCPAPAFGWSGNGHCYRRHDMFVGSWGQASAFCVEQERGHLATLTTAEENFAVAPAVSGAAFGPPFIGLISPAGDYVFVWTTGEPVGFTSWQGGGPAPGFVTPVATLLPDGRWETSDWLKDTFFVCERPAWTVDPATGHAYRLFYDWRTWDEAAASCSALGGHLATIGSPSEWTFVRSLLTLPTWLGGRRLPGGDFLWIDGTAVSDAPWAPGEPDGSGECIEAAAYTGFDWIDEPCTSTFPYLCEID